MEKLRFVLLCLWSFGFLGGVTAAYAQWTPMNPVTAVQQQTDGVLFTMGTGTLKLQVCSDSVIHVLYSRTSSFAGHPDYVIVKRDWPTTKWAMQSTNDGITLTTTRLKVVVTQKDGAITYSDLDGTLLVQEASRKLTPVKVNEENTYRAESFINIYGSREAFMGSANTRPEYGIIAENPWIFHRTTPISLCHSWSRAKATEFIGTTIPEANSTIDLQTIFTSASEVADVIDYYFFYGPELDKIIADYRELTGQAPMFGKWAYGFWQCKNRYKSQEEILGVAQKYRELHIPVDNIVQDWFWWNRKGEFVFNKNYPDPKSMVDQLHRRNFHLMISIWPFFEPGSTNYDYMDKQGWFVDKFKYAKPPYHAY